MPLCGELIAAKTILNLERLTTFKSAMVLLFQWIHYVARIMNILGAQVVMVVLETEVTNNIQFFDDEILIEFRLPIFEN